MKIRTDFRTHTASTFSFSLCLHISSKDDNKTAAAKKTSEHRQPNRSVLFRFFFIILNWSCSLCCLVPYALFLGRSKRSRPSCACLFFWKKKKTDSHKKIAASCDRRGFEFGLEPHFSRTRKLFSCFSFDVSKRYLYPCRHARTFQGQ